MSMSGRCLCGAVTYVAEGPAVFAGFCYCNHCRRSTGSHSAIVAVMESTFSMSGDVREYATVGDSGKEVARMFCPTCGTGILARPAARPGVILIKAGTLDDPEQFKPMACIYVSRAPSWDQPMEGIAAFPEARPAS